MLNTPLTSHEDGQDSYNSAPLKLSRADRSFVHCERQLVADGPGPLLADTEVDVDGFVDEVGFLGPVVAEAAGELGDAVANVCGVEMVVVGLRAEFVERRLHAVAQALVLTAESVDARDEPRVVGGD